MTTAKTKDKKMVPANIKSKRIKRKKGKKKKERIWIQLEVTVEIRTSGPAPIDDGNRTHP